MTTANAKLFAWHRLHLELQAARIRLTDAMGQAGYDLQALKRLDSEVRRLESETYLAWKNMDQFRSAQQKNGSD